MLLHSAPIGCISSRAFLSRAILSPPLSRRLSSGIIAASQAARGALDGGWGSDMEIRSIGLCLKHGQPQAEAAVREVVQWLKDRGLEVLGDDGCPAAAGVILS